MPIWRVTRRTKEYRELTDLNTGSIRKVMLASDKQWEYLETLRKRHRTNYSPLKERPTVFAAAKQIDKILKKEKQQKLL